MSENNKEDISHPVNKKADKKSIINRRDLLKGLAGIPVFGFFAYNLLEKRSIDNYKKRKVLEELGVDKVDAPQLQKRSTGKSGDLIRIGVIGFGSRGESLTRSIGLAHPEWTEAAKKDDKISEWLSQEDLNVAVTGICEVFDMRAERGLAAAKNELRPGDMTVKQLPVKRYQHYHELLESDEIDAVIIATPDHHHTPITIAAVQAGKHVYCEKSLCRTEEEVYEVYDAVKNGNVVFQLGHQYTKNTTFQKAKEIIEKDILGKISIIETTTNRNTPSGAWIRHIDQNGNLKPGSEKEIDWELWLGSRPKVPFSIERYYNWTQWWDYATGLVGQLFTHEYDAINQLLRIGIPKSVVASGGQYFYKDGRDMPDVFQSVFEYPDRDLTLIYSASLSSSHDRGRVFMGHDAWMELGDTLSVTADQDSTRFKEKINDGIINTSMPMFSFRPGSKDIDAVTSATAKYYASRGLIYTYVGGKRVNISHLHLKEWLDCIRFGGEVSADIEKAFEEGITCQMAHKSYLEKRRVEWDPAKKKII